MLVGGIGIVDLRLAGAFASLPVAALSRALTPVALGGLAIMLPTGFAMFAADAEALIGSATFWWKLGAIALALANALLFRRAFTSQLVGWERAAPPLGRALAALSLMLWLFVAWQGRMIAYT